jgi:uncharacterized LabA/DUF88 family protein
MGDVGEAALFVDGSFVFNVWRGVSRHGLDYRNLRKLLDDDYLLNGEKIVEAYFFNAEDDPLHTSTAAFHELLKKGYPEGPGFRLKLYWLARKRLTWPAGMGGGPVLHPQTGEQYIQIIQKGVDVGLAVHLMKSYHRRRWKTLFLAAGDGDFAEVVQYLVEDENVEMYLLGEARSTSSEIAQYARGIIELSDIRERIEFVGVLHEPNSDLPARSDGTDSVRVTVKKMSDDQNYGFVSVPGQADAYFWGPDNRNLPWPPQVGDVLVGEIVENFDLKKGSRGLKLINARPV